MTMQGGKHEKHAKHELKDNREDKRSDQAKKDADRLIELAKKVTKK